MAAWFAAIKTILPHLGPIIAAASPAFTRRHAGAQQDGLLQKQITELQAAAAQNAKHVTELAAQMQGTLGALERAAAQLEERLHTLKVLGAVAIGLSVLAICIALAAIAVRS